MLDAMTLRTAYDLAARAFTTASRLHRAAWWEEKLPGFVEEQDFGQQLADFFAAIEAVDLADLGDSVERLTAKSSGALNSAGLVAPGATAFAFAYAALLVAMVKKAIGREEEPANKAGLRQEDLSTCVPRMASILARFAAIPLPDERIEGEIGLEYHQANRMECRSRQDTSNEVCHADTRKPWTKAAAEAAVERFLREQHGKRRRQGGWVAIREIVGATGISQGLVAKTDAWGAYQERRKQERPSQSVKAQQLTEKMLQARGRDEDPAAQVGSEEAAFQRLVDEATPAFRAKLTKLSNSEREDLIRYVGLVQPSGSRDLLWLVVDQWLDDRSDRRRRRERSCPES